MKKLLLIALIAFGAPAWSQVDMNYKRCENLTYDVTKMILGGAPLELVFDYVKYFETQLVDGANDDNRFAKYLARTVYKTIGGHKKAGLSLEFIDVAVVDNFCNGALEYYKWRK